MKQPNIHILLIILLSKTLSVSAYNTRFYTHSAKEEIKSLRVRTIQSDKLQRPFLILTNGIVDGTDDKNTLEISFDCMSHDLRQYTYTVYHLNRDYTQSDLQSTEYLLGFTTQDIDIYELSNNTQQIYTHYSFTFPNDNMQITKSGNYVVHIYEDGNVDNTVADVCVKVVEPLVSATAVIRANTDKEINGRYQQLDIDLDLRHLPQFNPQEITLVVQQNNRTDNQVVVPHPTFVEPTRLRYVNEQSLIFEGGNEYRHFDIYSAYYAGYHVDRIRYERPDYHAFLDIDDSRGVNQSSTDKTGTPYIFEYDNNGQWLINAERTDYDDSEAEYMWVHWVLPMPAPFFDGSLYIGGDLFDNKMTLKNRMQYDNEQHCYYLNALLKQGAYDYQYWFLPKNSANATLLRTEGSHWQTKNDYSVAVYFRPIGERYDRLVAYEVFE